MAGAQTAKWTSFELKCNHDRYNARLSAFLYLHDNGVCVVFMLHPTVSVKIKTGVCLQDILRIIGKNRKNWRIVHYKKTQPCKRTESFYTVNS